MCCAKVSSSGPVCQCVRKRFDFDRHVLIAHGDARRYEDGDWSEVQDRFDTGIDEFVHDALRRCRRHGDNGYFDFFVANQLLAVIKALDREVAQGLTLLGRVAVHHEFDVETLLAELLEVNKCSADISRADDADIP
jgi:hypothetical protein